VLRVHAHANRTLPTSCGQAGVLGGTNSSVFEGEVARARSKRVQVTKHVPQPDTGTLRRVFEVYRFLHARSLFSVIVPSQLIPANRLHNYGAAVRDWSGYRGRAHATRWDARKTRLKAHNMKFSRCKLLSHRLEIYAGCFLFILIQLFVQSHSASTRLSSPGVKSIAQS